MADRFELKAEYNTLAADLAAVEQRTGLYLTDENTDAENATDAGFAEDTAEYWSIMLDSAKSAAGARAEAAGEDINALLGRAIY